jgi:hypothetical protein
MSKHTWKLAAVMVLLASALAGCGESLSSVTGKVTYKGQPVTEGTIIFSPIGAGGTNPGSPASANVKADGTYEMQTGTRNGAVIGKSTVSYTAPGGKASTDPKKQGEPSPYAGLDAMQTEVEVKSGKNVIDIQLDVAKPKKGVVPPPNG